MLDEEASVCVFYTQRKGIIWTSVLSRSAALQMWPERLCALCFVLSSCRSQYHCDHDWLEMQRARRLYAPPTFKSFTCLYISSTYKVFHKKFSLKSKGKQLVTLQVLVQTVVSVFALQPKTLKHSPWYDKAQISDCVRRLEKTTVLNSRDCTDSKVTKPSVYFLAARYNDSILTEFAGKIATVLALISVTDAMLFQNFVALLRTVYYFAQS